MTAALQSFRQEPGRVDDFRAHALTVSQGFDAEASKLEQQAADCWAQAATPGDPDTAESTRSQAKELEAEARKKRAAKTEWEKDIDRAWVLRHVTALEVFLRQFVIEKASADESLVRRFIEARDGLKLDSTLGLATASDAQERVAECVDKTRETFLNLEDVSKYFAMWFGDPFRPQTRLAGPLATTADKKDALDDVGILLQLRHVLVHKSGLPNRNYHDRLKECRNRLDPSAYTVTAGSFIAAPPDAVLASPSTPPGNGTKKDDLQVSLLRLAEHIDALYP